MRRVIFTRIARSELSEAQNWYASESPGLGRKFRVALDAMVERVRANPNNFLSYTITFGALSFSGFHTR